MPNLFDLDDSLLEKREEKSKDFSLELKKARAFCLRGLPEKALGIYNQILDEDFENEGALVGILRVHSDNFRIYEGKEIDNDVFAIENMCPDIMDEEYITYVSKRNELLKQKKVEAPKKEETKPEPKVVVKEETKKENKPSNNDEYSSLVKKAKEVANNDRQKAIEIYVTAFLKATNNTQRKTVNYEIAELYKDEALDNINTKENFDKAINYYLNCLLGCEQKDTYRYLSNFNIGYIYQQKGEIEKAIKYYLLAKDGYSTALYFLALAYYDNGDNLECSAYLMSYISDARAEKEDGFFFTDALYKFGMMHYIGDGIKQNLSVAKRSFERLRDLGDKRGAEMLKKL